ncbi:MAG: ATP-dependent 6-phosphofructokinase [bacterium]
MPNNSKKKIGIISSGGDCPGLNRVIDSLVRTLDLEYDIIGFIKGFEGLLDLEYIPLTRNFTGEKRWQSGVYLKSVNHGRFPGKSKDGVAEINMEVINKAKKNYDDLGLDGIIVIGGDGTLTIANNLSKFGFRFIAIPKSIDNDLSGTDFTFGFFSAVEVGKQAIINLHSTAFTHDRVIVVELMGREAGWITLYSGIAAQADVILIPEIEFSFENVSKYLKERIAKGKKYALVAIAEGCSPTDYHQVESEAGNDKTQGRLGGIASELTKYLVENNENIEVRSLALSYLQRSGTASSYDSFLAMQFGSYGAKMYREGKFGQMVSLKNGELTSHPIEEAVKKLNLVDPNSQVVKLALDNGIYFGQ